MINFKFGQQIPYTVRLRIIDDKKEAFCSGAILNKLFVITAAHCLMNENNTVIRSGIKIQITAGDLSISEWEPTQQDRWVCILI